MRKSKSNLKTGAATYFSTIALGQIVLHDAAVAVYHFFDEQFRNLAKKQGAHEYIFPDLISMVTLERFEFFSSFPQFATMAAHFSDISKELQTSKKENNLKGSGYALSPAVCYHAYDFFQKDGKNNRLLTITASGKCFRNEGKRLTHTPERLWNFTMREIVFIGTKKQVRMRLETTKKEVETLISELGMKVKLVEAHDPFFLGTARGKLLLQQSKKLKQELCFALKEGRELALASFNNHEDFFASRVKGYPSIKAKESGCVAFGLERFVYAFFQQFGDQKKHWPKAIRKYVEDYGQTR